MKIPLYQRRTQMTSDSGARPLSATASMSDYAAPANAAFSLGQTIAGVGNKLGEIALTEIKQENATLQAAEEAKFSDYVFKVQNDAVAGPIGQSKMVPNPSQPSGAGPRPGNLMPGPAETQQQHLQRYRVQMQRQIEAQASRIGDRDVRRRFKAAAAGKLRSALPGIQTQLRARYLDRHRAQMDQGVVNARRELTRHTEGSAMHAQIMRQTELSIVEAGRANGETDQNILKKIRTFKSDVVEDRVLADLQTFSMRDADAARKLGRAIDNFANPNSPFHDLTPDAAVKLSRLAKRQADMDELRLVRREEQQERKNERDAKKTGEKNYERYMYRMDQARKAFETGDPAGGDDGTEITMPTDAEISSDRSLNDKQRMLLRQRLIGADRIVNPAAVARLENAILDAVTDDDLETIRRDIVSLSGDGIIGQKARQTLLKSVDGAKKKSPEMVERKQYQQFLKVSLGIKSLESPFSFNQDDATTRLKSAEVLNLYQTKLAAGVRPAEAAFQTLTEFAENREDAISSIARVLPADMRDLVLDKQRNLRSQNLAASIAKMREMWRAKLNGYKSAQEITAPIAGQTQQQLGAAQRAGKLTRSQRLGVRQLFEIESRIDAIERLFNDMPRANPAGGGDAKNKEEPGSFNFQNLFGGSDKPPTAERR